MAPQRKALLVATYGYQDPGLRRLAAPAHDAEALADVLRDPDVAGFDVTVLLDEPAHVVGEAIGDFYAGCRRDDLTLLYFSGHGLKDDDGRLYLAMTNTRRDALLFTGLPAASISDAMDGCPSRRKVLVLDCCYSGAFPAGRTAKADPAVHTLERFQGRGRAVLTASDATSYSFEGDEVTGSGSRSVFTRYLVEAMRSGAADLDADGDITLDELYSWVRDRVVTEMPQQRPKKQEDVEGRIVIARNVAWELPRHLRYAIDSPIAAQRLGALDGLGDLYLRGNERVRDAVERELTTLVDDDSRSVSTAATELLVRLGTPPEPAEPEVRPEVPVVPAPAAVVTKEPPPAPEPGPPPAAAAPVAAEPPPREAPPARPRVAGPHRAWVLVCVAVAGALLTASRSLVFEAGNGYSAADLDWTTATWTVEVTVPLLLAAGLLLVRRWGRAGDALAAGLVAGALLGLVGDLTSWRAFFVYAGYATGPAWWLLLAGVVVLAVGVAVAVSSGVLRPVPSLRRDPAALVATAAVAASLGVWLFAIGHDLSVVQWFWYLAPGVVFTLACLPVTLLRLTPDQRRFALPAVTVFGAALEVGGILIITRSDSDYDVPAVVRAIGAVLLSLIACYAAQLLPARAPGRVPADAERPR
ncbi:caspase family protein [Geodermatophilus sp. URMC 64]